MRFFASACVLIFAGCSEEKKTATTTNSVATPAGALVPSSSRSASLRSIGMPVKVLRLELYTNPDALKMLTNKLNLTEKLKAVSQISKLLAPSLAVDPIFWRAILKHLDKVDDPVKAAHLTLLASSSDEELVEMSEEVAFNMLRLPDDIPGLWSRSHKAKKYAQ